MFLNAYRIKYLALQRKIQLQNAEKTCDRVIFFFFFLILVHSMTSSKSGFSDFHSCLVGSALK